MTQLETISLTDMTPTGISGSATPFAAHSRESLTIKNPVLAISTGETEAAILASPNRSISTSTRHLSQKKGLALIIQLFLVSLLCSTGNGLMTIGIPVITADLALDPSLTVWPVLVYTLVSGTLLLLAGSVADVLGGRLVNLAGVLALGLLALVTGFVKNGPQLIAARVLSGIALAMFLPTAVSLVSLNIPSGRMRNMGFSFIGVGQAVGYALGLVVGGILVETAGWRVGYYMCGTCLIVLFVSGLYVLPHNQVSTRTTGPGILMRLKDEIDWAGVAMSSTSLALLAYVLAEISSSTSNASKAHIITLLIISVLLVPACVFWFKYRERIRKPALISPALFNNLPFTTICIMMMFTFAELATAELLASLYMQKVQQLSALQTSVKLLPNLIVGASLNFATGLFVHKVPAIWLVLVGASISAVSPLLMALVNPEWPYWYMVFPAQALLPFCADILFTVALLVVSEIFPEKEQALAGALFNTVSQFGQSIGLAIIGVVTNSVTQAREDGQVDTVMPTLMALLAGYRAGFWTAFAWMMSVCFLAVFGLRKIGKVGLKRD